MLGLFRGIVIPPSTYTTTEAVGHYYTDTVNLSTLCIIDTRQTVALGEAQSPKQPW